MNIQHFEKNFQYTAEEMLYVARKIGKLATYCKRLKDDASFITIEAERRPTEKKRDEMKVDIIIQLPGKVLKADSLKANVTEAIDRCIEKLEPQVKKYKELRLDKKRAQ
jgi:ribosomal subunit interface protein